MIFSVIPWSSIFGGSTGPADYLYDARHDRRDRYWFELNWWFPQLAMLFVIASVLVGVVARMGEKETVRLIAAGAADMIGPALVVLLAGGVSVIMTNTQTLDTILHSMEQLVSGTSAGMFAFVTILVNMPLAVPDPVELRSRRAGHAPAVAARRLRRRQPVDDDHRVDHGPRPDAAVVADQRRRRRRARHRQGPLRPLPAVRVAAPAGHVCCGGRGGRHRGHGLE